MIEVCADLPGGEEGDFNLISGKSSQRFSQSRNLSVVLQRDFKSFFQQPLKTLKAAYSQLKPWCKDVRNFEKRMWEVGLNKRCYLISFGASSSSYLFFSFLLIVSLTTRRSRESPSTTPHTAPAIMPMFCAPVVQKTNLLVTPCCRGQVLVHATSSSTGFNSGHNAGVYLFYFFF